MSDFERAKHISKCLELAILLEVSANKPGNVNFVVGFEGTRIEHFLASAVAADEYFEEAARQGLRVLDKKISTSDIGVGKIIRGCAADVQKWQRGGNTLIGTIMLFVPIAAAAGMTPMRKDNSLDLDRLRENIGLVTKATTPQDAVGVYEAIEIAKPSGLNEAPDLDVNDPRSKQRLLDEGVSLYEVFEIAAGYDDVCSEFINNFPIAFDLAYPYLMNQLESCDLETAIIHTFLKVLSEHPDSFVARKVGLEKTRGISLDAKKILDLGGVKTIEGRKSIHEFDAKLRKFGNLYNPGTTADITAVALALCTLSGYRP